ncbi:unnamed protein product [Mytilus coruscus]|uniref:Alpha/beta hydrolase fold-5 domain-containing protein n=1 Tax=Mytilus coruscus TaxID=42192 RepID=A0A6J8BF59_MYTCO|nr:unnamed protein product [Mytilus coruscus]
MNILCLAALSVLHLHLCFTVSVNIVKSYGTAPEYAMILIPAKDIPGSSYKPLAEALVKQSNQTLIVVYLDDQPTILQMPVAFAKALSKVILNGHTGKVFLAAHGDGGQLAAAFGTLPSRYIEGIVLFSSYLIRGSRLNSYPLPILTISGDLDGLTRVTRILDTFEELQGDVAQNPNQKFRSPVIVMEGINYGQFASKANITYDLNPEVSQADAFGIIFNYTYAFMVATQNDLNKNIVAAQAVLEQGYLNTETLLQPLSEVKALDQNLEQVSYWTITAQQLIINSLTAISVEFVNHESDMHATKRQQHKHPFRVLDDLKINSTTKIEFTSNPADKAILPQSPTQLKATMTSQDAVKKLTTSSQFGNPSTCQDINQEAVNFVYSKSSATAQRRYQAAKAPITFLNDVNASTFDQWNQANLQLIYNNSGLFVGATRFRTNKPNSDQSIGEQDDCTLLSPYRVMEWIYIDALRYGNQQITKEIS